MPAAMFSLHFAPPVRIIQARSGAAGTRFNAVDEPDRRLGGMV